MQLSDFDYNLPEDLIAQYPLRERSASRLLCLNVKTGAITHESTFKHILNYLQPYDFLVFNNTQVIAARLYGRRISGGRVEILLERILGPTRVLAQVKSSKSLKINEKIYLLEDNSEMEIVGWEDNFHILECHSALTALELFEQFGEIPLPPYMKRTPCSEDYERYQTIFASHKGAVAAPTAGLHFDQTILQALQAKNVTHGTVTLHIGSGTFQPVRVQDITQHHMHKEYFEVSQQLCDQVANAKKNKGRIIAVGTTSVRCLETTMKNGTLHPYQGETNCFIYPGYSFQCIDALITNFHVPKSTLIMLVAALGGYENVMRAYAEAIKQGYRFFSYGDAMFLYNECG